MATLTCPAARGGVKADSKGRVSCGQAVKGMGVKANREKKEQEDT